MREKVSLIIPVYNDEGYLDRNIQSLLNQTYKNIEIILINDGSTDNSLSILEKYQKLDDRIIVINQSNKGVSFSRNVGLDVATGAYVSFIDGDDYVDCDYVEYILGLAIKNKCEMAISTQHHYNDYTFQDEKQIQGVVSSLDIINAIYLNRIYMAVWNKIYSLDFIRNNHIRFNETLWYAEGMNFNIQCLAAIKKVAIGNRKIYHYYYNPNSAMRKGFKLENELNALKSLDDQREILKAHGVEHNNALEFHYAMVNYMILCGILKNKEQSYTDFVAVKNKARKNIKTRKKDLKKVNLSIKDKVKWRLISFMPILMAKIYNIKNK